MGTQSVAERERREASAWSGAKVVPLKRALKAQKFPAAATGGSTATTRPPRARRVVGFTPSSLEANWNLHDNEWRRGCVSQSDMIYATFTMNILLTSYYHLLRPVACSRLGNEDCN